MKLEWIGHACFRLTANDGTVALVILTHSAAEKSLRAALAELATLSINQSPVKLMRIEDI